MKTFKGKMASLTLLWRKSLSYRNHSIDRDIYDRDIYLYPYMDYKTIFNPFLANVPILDPLKTAEYICFQGV